MKLRLIIFGLILAAITVTGDFVINHTSQTKHSVVILNRTSEDIKVTQVRIDNNVFNSGGTLLRPTRPTERRSNPSKYLTYNYKSTGESLLSITAIDNINTPMQMSCRLIDQNRAGCVYYVSIKEFATLTCVCDSNADFQN